jgi:hypothetical protein
MKKGYMIGLTLSAVCAFSAMGAASAFAAPEWLAGTAVIGKALPAEANGEVILTDLKVPLIGAAGVTCKGTLDGTVGPGSADEITEVLNNASPTKEKVEELPGLALKCASHEKCEGESNVWPVNLPWKSTLELSGTAIIDNLVAVKGGGFGWEVECTVIGVKEDDTCLVTLGEPKIENMTGAEAGVLGVFDEENKAECSLSKEKSGDVTGAGGLTTLVNKEALAVSGE